MHSWRPATSKQYGSYFKRWMLFCSETEIDKINPSLGQIMAFLTRMHDDGLSYSAINTAKSMLSSLFAIIHKCDMVQKHSLSDYEGYISHTPIFA